MTNAWIALGVIGGCFLLVSLLFYPKFISSLLRFLGYIGIRMCVAALAIYVLNVVGGWLDFRVAINGITVAVVALLGIPGYIAVSLLTYITT